MEAVGPEARAKRLQTSCSFSSAAPACKGARWFLRSRRPLYFTFGLVQIQEKYLINTSCVPRNKKRDEWTYVIIRESCFRPNFSGRKTVVR